MFIRTLKTISYLSYPLSNPSLHLDLAIYVGKDTMTRLSQNANDATFFGTDTVMSNIWNEKIVLIDPERCIITK